VSDCSISCSPGIVLDFSHLGDGNSETLFHHIQTFVAWWNLWGKSATFVFARMSPGGQKAVKAAGGVLLVKIIHHGLGLSN
jgi:hypothetical protein